MSRIIGIGFVDSIAAIFTEMASDCFGVKEVFYLKNIDNAILHSYEFPGVKTSLLMTSIGSFVKGPQDKFFFCVVNPAVKKKLYGELQGSNAITIEDFPAIVHPSAFCSRASQLSAGVMVEYGAIISPHVTIDFGVHIKRGANLGHHNIIGRFCSINPGVVTSGYVQLGEGVTLGTGAVISNNISIGAGSLIGAGSVVTRDIPPGVIAYGNPCKIMRDNDKWKI